MKHVRWKIALLAFGLFAAGPLAPAHAQEGRLFALVATGVSGDSEHYDKFWTLESQMRKALRSALGVPDDRILMLFEDKDEERKDVFERSTAAGLQKAVAALAEQMTEADTVLVFLAGHADRVSGRVAWHLPGPDLGPEALAGVLAGLRRGRVVIVMATPLSGYFMAPLAARGRIVITATLPRAELSETYFPYAFIEAVGDPKTDADGDGSVSVAELFTAACARVEAFYKEKNLMRTEHALIDDTGDGIGSPQLNAESPDGKLAGEVRFRRKASL